MKILLFVLLSIYSTVMTAQDLSFEKRLQELENNRLNQRSGTALPSEANDLTGIEKDKGSYTTTPEFSFFYVQFGKPIFSYNNEKTFGSSYSIGHKRSADTFIYGIEYNNSSINSDAKLNDISIQMGFTTIWRHRFQPFITLNFGTSFLKDESLDIDTTGYRTTLDLGINLNPYSIVKFYSGMRMSYYIFEKIPNNSIKSQELYVMLGFSF